MKKYPIILSFIFCLSQAIAQNMNELKFLRITNQLSLDSFEKIKLFVLENGDRQTYRNFDNNNPHYNFETFDVYLGSNIGQRNSNNDPKLSDFNQLIIRDNTSYFEIIIVRTGDLAAKRSWIVNGMIENEVYLTSYDQKTFDEIPLQFLDYIEKCITLSR